MKEKYYTPKPEEFCIGFKCEERFNSGKQDDTEFFELTFDISDFEKINNENYTLRIKYLDEEDIESLGFYKHHNTYYSNSDAYGIEIMDNNAVLIFKNQSIGNVDLFYGTIKNKHELEVILKQIGIN